MPEISDTGAWFDTQAGKVVYSEPEEGRLLVAPGGPLTPDVKRAIEVAEAHQSPVLSVGQPLDVEGSEKAAPAKKAAPKGK
jgi:hypothetical protein